MKTTRTFSIDAEVYERFQARYPYGASAFCEDAMRKRLELDENALEGVNDEILEAEEKKITKILDDKKAALQKIKEQRELIKNKTEENRLHKLNEEKERLEKLKKCSGCGCQIGENSKRTPVGNKIFCHECFMNSHPAFLKALKEAR